MSNAVGRCILWDPSGAAKLGRHIGAALCGGGGGQSATPAPEGGARIVDKEVDATLILEAAQALEPEWVHKVVQCHVGLHALAVQVVYDVAVALHRLAVDAPLLGLDPAPLQAEPEGVGPQAVRPVDVLAPLALEEGARLPAQVAIVNRAPAEEPAPALEGAPVAVAVTRALVDADGEPDLELALFRRRGRAVAGHGRWLGLGAPGYGSGDIFLLSTLLNCISQQGCVSQKRARSSSSPPLSTCTVAARPSERPRGDRYVQSTAQLSASHSSACRR